MERKRNVLEMTAQALDLPPDAVGLPRIELLGDQELRVSYHKGILAYGGEEIHISGGKLVIRVLGSGLVLRGMNASELRITGRIRALELT